jgi:hypothetical protein
MLTGDGAVIYSPERIDIGRLCAGSHDYGKSDFRCAMMVCFGSPAEAKRPRIQS